MQIAIEETANENNDGKISKIDFEKCIFNPDDDIEASLMQSIFVKLNKADLLGNTRTMDHNSWINFINEGYNSKNFSEFLKEKKIEILKFFLEDDIPLAFLGHIWMLISKGFLHLKAKKDSNEFDVISLDLENPHIRESKKSKIKQKNEFVIDEIDYEELLSQVKPETLDQIEKDIARTNWPYDAYLRNSKINKEKIVDLNKEELQKLKEIDLILRKQCKNILSAFSVAVKETGYIQGMHSICAAVVYNCFVSKWALGKTNYKDQIELEMRFDEEDIFYIFYGIMKYLKLTEAYMYGFKLMMQKIEEFGQILKTRNPEVHRTLTKNGVRILVILDAFDALFRFFLLDSLPSHDSSPNLQKNNFTIFVDRLRFNRTHPPWPFFFLQKGNFTI